MQEYTERPASGAQSQFQPGKFKYFFEEKYQKSDKDHRASYPHPTHEKTRSPVRVGRSKACLHPSPNRGWGISDL